MGDEEVDAMDTQEREQGVEKPRTALRNSMEAGRGGVLIRSLQELVEFSKTVAATVSVPSCYQHQKDGPDRGRGDPAAIAIGIQAGMELGFSPLAALRAMTLINGYPTLRGEAFLALVRNDQRCDWIELNEVDGEGEARGVTVRSKRRGHTRIESTRFTVTLALKAGLWNKSGPWQTYPERQLQWRSVGWHAKDYWSDVTQGIPIAEEFEDYPALAKADTRSEYEPPQLPAVPTRDPLLDSMFSGDQPQAPPPVPVPVGAPIVPVEATLPPAPQPVQPAPPKHPDDTGRRFGVILQQIEQISDTIRRRDLLLEAGQILDVEGIAAVETWAAKAQAIHQAHEAAPPAPQAESKPTVKPKATKKQSGKLFE